MVIFRPRAALLAAGPVLVLAGIALAVAVTPVVGAAVVVLGVLCLPAWRYRIEVGNDVVVAHGLVGATEIPFGEVREVRLRRVPVGPPRPPHRSYRIGRFSTTPIRLRIIGDHESIQLTAALWASWPALMRVVLGIPGVTSDSRTRGRLDRYG